VVIDFSELPLDLEVRVEDVVELQPAMQTQDFQGQHGARTGLAGKDDTIGSVRTAFPAGLFGKPEPLVD
jgi:hypothetical protein